MGTFKVLGCFTRKFMMAEVEPPEDVKVAFRKYTEGGAHMTAEHLRRFLIEVQKEDPETEATLPRAENLLQQILHTRHHIAKFTRHTLTLDDFHHYLFSVDLNPPINSKVHHDMKAPLSHYFIYTGHNSYLKGNQLTSDCSDEPIIKALKKGVRVIELDIWPNSAKDGVDVLHGRTATTPVELIKCLRAIKEHAFSASPYPVIITLEDHLTPELQAQVAQMLIETFGETLYYPESPESECLKEFPSPEDLKHRIIVSTKPPKEYLESKSRRDKHNGSQNGKNVDEDNCDEEPSKSATDHKAKDNKGFSKLNSFLNGFMTKTPKGYIKANFSFKKNRDHPQKEKDSDEDVWGEEPSSLTAGQEDKDENDSDSSDYIQDDEDDDDTDQKLRAAPAYKSLIAIPAGKPKGGMREVLKVEPNKVRRLSLSEQGLEKAVETHGKDVVRFTQKNILRVYPKGTRVTSSNYKPLIGWMHGAQMVAFNMQGYGRSLWLMQGMFRSNGGCGYVKKPDFIMHGDSEYDIFDPEAKLPVKKTLKVKVYMGDGWHLDFKQTHFDFFSPPDFYTRVGIAGVPADVKMKKTKTKEDRWIPVWGEEFTFPLTVPELALLRVEVHEYDMSEKDDFAGQTCLPVSELRPGIRAVPLCNRKGEKFNSVRLLMHFEYV